MNCKNCIHYNVCQSRIAYDENFGSSEEILNIEYRCNDFKLDCTKHAKWIEASPKSKIGKKCSNCGARIKYSECFNGNHIYCHKCGARMDAQFFTEEK